MNKKVLFVFHRMNIGGSGTSLMNLMELFSKRGVKFDLFLMSHEGVFLERAKKAANVLPEDKKLASVVCEPTYLKKDIIGLIFRVLFILKKKLFKNYSRETVYEKAAKKIKGYDVVISFQEGVGQRFTRYIDAKKKISWIHNEYCWIKGGTDEEMKDLFDAFDIVAGVSKVATQSVIDNLQIPPEKTTTVYNTFATDAIIEKSKAYSFDVDKTKTNFVSVGRFAEQKQFLRAVDVAVKLKDAGCNFCWYIAGNGEQYRAVVEKVKQLDVSDCLILTGAKSNPYPIISACDCLVVPSLYEAHPMVANEALILHRPVISTLYPSTTEVIADGENGIICENSVDGIFSTMKQFIENEDVRRQLHANVKDFIYNNDLILKQIEELFE